MPRTIRTGRLELIPATHAILAADLNDRGDLARLLTATIPSAWPPPLMDEGVLREFLRLQDDPAGPLFAAWYWVLEEPGGGRTLIGSGGILQAEGRYDTAVLGYSVLEEFWNHGYATEAVRALLPEIFPLPGVRRIIATTYPDLTASIRVLEKCGFTRTDPAAAGTGAEEGSVCFVREREYGP